MMTLWRRLARALRTPHLLSPFDTEAAHGRSFAVCAAQDDTHAALAACATLLSMHVDKFREYCLRKAGVTESSPFGPEHIVFKVGGKMFALLAFEEVPPTANLKCDPDRALELRDRYESVQPGYHMNKKHWNTVVISGGEIPEAELTKMIDDSYELVVGSLPKKLRASL